MVEKKTENNSMVIEIEKLKEIDFLTIQEVKEFSKLFTKCMKSYKSKSEDLSDKEWLKELFREELPDLDEDELEEESSEIVMVINEFDLNLESINEAIASGISKEAWLANKLQETAVGMSINEYGMELQNIDDFLYKKNAEMHEALTRSSDGHIKMSRNLDGNIAENMIAKSTELSGLIQGKNIKVEVRDVFTSNSVDVRAINLETGQYQNYQMKFGKTAKETIKLINKGDYRNQRLIVPTEQLEEIKQAFPSKTVDDHIEAWGTKGKQFTKETVKELQILAQEDGLMPSMDYNHYQTKDLAMSIGKNVGVMAMQSAAVTTGLNIAYKYSQGERIETDEIIEIALTAGVDTGVKVVTAGALQVAVRKELISIIPKMTPAGIIANIACVGIENAKILGKIAIGDLSIIRGLDQMGRVTTSMMGGLWGLAKGSEIGLKLTAWIPIIGAPMSIITGFIGGMVGYFGGSKIGDAIYTTAKNVCNVAKTVAETAWQSITSVGRSIKNGTERLLGKIFR